MNSIKNKTITLKCTEYASVPLTHNTKNQQIIKNDIIQNEISSTVIESVDSGHPDAGMQLIAHSGEECKQIMKENVMGDELKDYSGLCDDSSVCREHIERNFSSLCKEDDGDFDKSQYSNYSRAPCNNVTEASHFLNCETLSDCNEKVNEMYRVDKIKEENLTEGDKKAEFTLAYRSNQINSSSLKKSDGNEQFKLERLQEQGKGMIKVCLLDKINSDKDITVDTISCSCHSVIRNGIDDTQKSSDCKSLDIYKSINEVDGLRIIWTETAQDLNDGDRKLVGLQSTSEVTDETRAEYDRNQGVCTRKTFSVDDKNVGTGQVGSTVILTGISDAVTEDRGTINDVVLDGTVKLNTNGADVSDNVEVTYTNVGKKLEIVENRTVAGTQKTMAKATKRIGFFELVRSPVLRKYNLIMVFVW